MHNMKNSTTNQIGYVAIEGQAFVRDLQSKAVLPYDKSALNDSRRKRLEMKRERESKLEVKAEIAKLNNDITELKNEFSEIKELLKNALSQFINTNKIIQ